MDLEPLYEAIESYMNAVNNLVTAFVTRDRMSYDDLIQAVDDTNQRLVEVMATDWADENAQPSKLGLRLVPPPRS